MEQDSALSASRLRFGEFAIDLADERLLGPDGPVKIGHKAYCVLLALIEHDGRLLTKEALFSSVWDGTIVSESALTSVIKELRRALGDLSRTPRYIESVYGRGYRFIERVEGVAPKPPAVPAPVAAATPAERQQDAPPVIIVSRFDDAAVHDSFPHCASQLREEVLAGLARFREVQLVTDDMGESGAFAGRRGYRLTATLLPDVAGVKVSARASRTDGRVIWAESLSLGRDGTVAGIQTIVRRIVGSALPAVGHDVDLGLPTVTEAYYDRYLLAKRQSMTVGDHSPVRESTSALEQLVAERPDFGPAYFPLVRLYNTDFGFTAFGSSGSPERARALNLARAGLAADRGNVHAYTLLGFCFLYHSEPELARSYFEQALALNPYNPVRVNEVASGMIYLGDFDRAADLLALGLELQIFADDNHHQDSGLLALARGDFPRARNDLLAIARPSILADLYLALAEVALARESAEERLSRWQERLRAGWYEAACPSPARLQQWIRFHHPFQHGAGDHLFRLAEAAADAPRPRARLPVAE